MKIEISTLSKNAVASRDKTATNMEVNYHFDFDTTWAEKATVKRTDATGTTKTYTPLQVHWHTPSEHTVDNKQYDAEAHLVSKNADGTYSAVGIFFDKSVGGGA